MRITAVGVLIVVGAIVALLVGADILATNINRKRGTSNNGEPSFNS